MDDDDQMMYPADAEILNSEEEFHYPSNNSQPSTSFFATSNFLLNSSCRDRDLFMQQQIASSHGPQSTNELAALQYLALPLIQLARTELSIDPQLILSKYFETIKSLSLQPLLAAAAPSHLIPELLNSLAWDQWLCFLATTLTPAQWQLYWMNYLVLFGTLGLPQHLVNFFTSTATFNFSPRSYLLSSLQTNTADWMIFRQQFYE
ncbi:unnamed protein product [Onchocerca ochengi]|uniref:NR LBD domain-containing protein n=1 Tax=Onchocerca ochengi TaxID=42157 RepID=A0A182EWT5_ONCOC|nr:unnamed protein product [Onchocerca ochengi]